MLGRRIVVFGLAMVVILVVFYVVVSPDDDDDEVIGNSHSEAVAENKQIIRRTKSHHVGDVLLRGAIRTLNTRVSDLENAKTGQSTEEEPEVEFELEQHLNDLRGERARAIEKLRPMNDAFEEEERDHEWSSTMEQNIQSAFESGEFNGTTIISSSCKKTFCRMEVHHQDVESSFDFEKIVNMVGGNFYMQHLEIDDDGTSNTVSFFIRQEMRESNIIYQMAKQN